MSKSLSTTKEPVDEENVHEKIVRAAFTKTGLEALEKQLMPIAVKDPRKAKDIMAIIKALTKLK
jgi:hypothetical protein